MAFLSWIESLVAGKKVSERARAAEARREAAERECQDIADSEERARRAIAIEREVARDRAKQLPKNAAPLRLPSIPNIEVED